MRILVVDDEPELTALLARGLTGEGHEVTTAFDGLEALRLADEHPADLAVVDVMLPGMSGFELSRHLKSRHPTMAVILLTARGALDDKVRGLDSGADDYMVKPFEFAELAARIRAVRRRDGLASPAELTIGSLVIDLARHRVRVGDREIVLSRTEFDVLRALVTSAGETVTRDALLQDVWGTSRHIAPNIVDQYVSYLRRKLDQEAAGIRIATVRGVGFGIHAVSA